MEEAVGSTPQQTDKQIPGNGEGSEARIYSTCTQWVWTVTSAETHFKASYKLLGLSAPALLLPPLWPELGPADGLLVPKQNTEI